MLSMVGRNSASRNTDGSATATKLASIAMVLAVIFFFLLFILILFLYVYTRYYRIGRYRTHRRTHFVVAANDASIPNRGLNPSILLSLPISIYHSNDVKERLECAVCLCELNDGEKARLLPNCNHGFHLECIDMWFHSHSTCPLCRCPVGGEDGLHISESATLDIVRSGLQEERMLVISTPDRSTGMFQLSLSPLTSSTSQVEEITSPFEVGRSPASLNGESLKRSLSREKMIGGSCCHSPEVSDIELGLVEYGEVNGEGSSVFPKP